MFGYIYKFLFLFLRVSGSGKSFPPPLDKEKEAEYFKRARNGDADAREKLIEHNLRLVAHIVKKYYSAAVNTEDLMSIGTIGLIKAIDSFDINKGAKFATYASKCLQNEILMYFRSLKKTGNEVSINEAIDTDKDGNPLTYVDIICCEDTIAEDINFRINCRKAMKAIKEDLSDRERRIIIARYGLEGNRIQTQREIAKKMDISRSYVSRIEKGALEKIRSHLTGE